MMKTISIIIPMYNCKKNIQCCVDSILNQSYKDIELLLIDDGSKDGTFDFCENLYKKNNKIKLYKKENGGPSSARNYGLDNATGKYIFFVDSDDMIEKNTLLKLINNFKKEELIGTQYKILKNNRLLKQSKRRREYEKDEFIKQVLNDCELGVVWGYLYENELIGDLRFDEKTAFMEDTLFQIMYMSNIKKIRFIDDKDSNYIYNYSENSLTNNPKKVIKNINDFCYSLSQINNYTQRKYENEVKKKKNSLLEKEGRKFSGTENFEQFIKLEIIEEIIEENAKNKLFVLILKTKNIYFLKIYYKIRKIIKRIYLKIKKGR